MGIYSIKKAGLTKTKGRDHVGVGIRSSYIRVVGIQVDTEGTGKTVLGQLRCFLSVVIKWSLFKVSLRLNGLVVMTVGDGAHLCF